MHKRSLHIISPTSGSIGEITNDLTLGLFTFFNLTVEGKDEPKERDILLSHFINPEVVKADEFNTFKHKVLIQPIDGTVIDKGIVDLMNRYDLIITPANAGRLIMIQNGVTTPIKVVPNFYKPLPERDLPELDQLPQKFIFYHESTFHPRKGVEFLYEGFVRAFSDTQFADQVCLVCKDSPYNKLTFDRIERLKREAMELQATYKHPAQIIKISQELSWDQLQALWKRANAYVSFAKMEGFGIPLLRMAQMNKRIITLDAPCNGYLDFLNHSNSILIPTKMVRAEEEHMNLYTDDTEWAVPSMEKVIEGFRNTMMNVLAGTETGLDQKEIEKYEYSNVMGQYRKIFENL